MSRTAIARRRDKDVDVAVAIVRPTHIHVGAEHADLRKSKYAAESRHGPGPAKGGTGVLSVDGKEMARKKLEHTIPLMMTVDETFDVGLDTGTGVDESYKLPFRFTGTIDKLTFKLGRSQMTAAEQRAIEEKLILATD